MIQYIGQATGSSSASLPAHQAGDLLLAFAYRDGNNNAPALASGWTDIASANGANTNSSRLAYKFAASDSEDSGTWNNADELVILVYRGVASIGANNYNTGNSTTVNYPALTLNASSGSSWVVGFAGHRSTNTSLETAPSGMTNRANVQDATAEASGHDTNGGVTGWSSTNVSVGGTSSGWFSRVVELISPQLEEEGSETEVQVTAEGAGEQYDAAAEGSTAAVEIAAEGAGEQIEGYFEGSQAAVEVAASGAGLAIDAGEGGSDATISVSATGAGESREKEYVNLLEAAIREAYATAPAGEVILHTLEFRHPAFTAPLRVVRDHRELVARLESTAPENPNEEVTFVAFAFDFVPPDVDTTGAMPEVIIAIDNVSSQILGYMDQAANSQDLIEMTYRPYLASDPSEPQMDPPLTLTVRSVEADIFRITARASYGDFVNRSFPSEVYNSTRFPGLIAS